MQEEEEKESLIELRKMLMKYSRVEMSFEMICSPKMVHCLNSERFQVFPPHQSMETILIKKNYVMYY